MSSLATVILAAGEGTRMKSALPKVLHKLGGVPMLAHVLRTAKTLGPERIVTVIGPGMDAVAACAKQEAPEGHIVTQQTREGTGHAVRQAVPHLEGFSGIVLVLYGDTPLLSEATLRTLTQRLEKNPAADIALLAMKPENPGEYGRLLIHAEGTVKRIIEYRDADEEQRALPWCNSGVMAIRSETLFTLLPELTNQNAKKEYYLTDLVGLATSLGKTTLAVDADATELLGVNSRAELAALETHIQQRLRLQWLENGAMLLAPDTVFLSASATHGRDVLIHPFAVIGENVHLGDNVEIKSYSHLENCRVEKGGIVGPYARLRPGAHVGENAHVGNFVEIKNATLAKGAKANHLTYIGDAVVGEGSNIGAGTITCNYDGVSKHKTEIGANVFIGSDTCLVAPVSVGDGAIVGAGSVITENVPPNAIAVTRAKQEHGEGKAEGYWKKRRK
ncbi:MAG: bifunctional UDP-N-acetylglucosamine diphosphorylase/glucosamine-1-phosphate N-acetyltransferase GlmU [Alphaproteobacteria bacterium]|nr:bifunctional UDP-N-acetylglucosamine diphosphorylase/glucosamine-1-phosphate N-acetyltransferase GlmU [Alphaproteobacteria bacterium]